MRKQAASWNCEVCGALFSAPPSKRRRFCSLACAGKQTGIEKTKPSKQATVPCPSCGKVFTYYLSWPRKFCSNVCKGKATVTNIRHFAPSGFTTTCEQCGASFSTSPALKARFCSQSCFGKWQSLHVVGDAHPRQGRTFGRPARYPLQTLNCAICGKAFSIKPSQAARRRCCSRVCYGTWMRLNTAGENNAMWRGGVDPYYGPSWRSARRAARARDKVCVDCGAKPSRTALHVHHLVAFRTFGIDRHADANALDNLVSLCATCHTLRHHERRRLTGHW